MRKPFTLGGFDYEADSCALAANIHLIHHDPEPHALRPERFLEQGPGTFTRVPFGGGRGRCLGRRFAMLEIRIVLREVLRAAARTAVGPPARPNVRPSARTTAQRPSLGTMVRKDGRSPRMHPEGRTFAGGP